QHAGRGVVRIGVIGVWTEAKVSYLLYDLKTRLRIDALATCSALTASASRAQHFNALEQLRKLLGVSVFDSVGAFADWLVPEGRKHLPVSVSGAAFGCQIELAEAEGEREPPALDPSDEDLLRTLYRQSARIRLQPMGGGFSGALVFSVESHDALGHQHAPSVAKLGPRELIGKERVAFERVEAILGNDAPSVRGFVDLGERAGIKYGYAAMGQGKVTTFKALYERGADQDEVDRILQVAFGDILGRFYRAARYERLPLLEHYGFHASLADRVQENVARILGPEAAAQETLTFPGGLTVDNLVGFYRTFLAEHDAAPDESRFVSYVHGDLNGANILIDARRNVWLIDFFHTAPGHVLKDLAKLENDLLYIFTPLQAHELPEALELTRALRAVKDLRAPLAPLPDTVTVPSLRRAWETLRTLRAMAARLVASDRDPLQLSVALLRYAAHTMTFDESSEAQKRWALAAACGHAADIKRAYRDNARLRVDWIEHTSLGSHALGLTICPGRVDRGRRLASDLLALVEQGCTHLLCLLTDAEMAWAGVAHLPVAAAEHRVAFRHHPVPDQEAPTLAEAQEMVAWIEAALAAGGRVVCHCMGGLGRSGTIAACVLQQYGATASDAVAAVRETRGPRAVETRAQDLFVGAYVRLPKLSERG
ncbi:MAG: phosphatase domain-containing putative toxin, partial [Planctomycetota bacterium]